MCRMRPAEEKHVRTVHAGQTVTFTSVLEKSQQTMSAFFKHSAPNLSNKEEGSDNDKSDIARPVTHTAS